MERILPYWITDRRFAVKARDVRTVGLLAALMVAAPAKAQDTLPTDGQPLPDITYTEQPYVEQTVEPTYVEEAPAPAYAEESVAPDYVEQTGDPSASSGPTLEVTHGDWEIRCLSPGDCVMTQMHRRTATSADVAFTVIKPGGIADGSGNAVETFAEIVVPLGVYLPGGIGLKIDEHPAQAAPYERCISQGCVVRAPITPEMVGQMKRGSTAYVVIFGGPDKPIKLPISLAGFTAAYNSL